MAETAHAATMKAVVSRLHPVLKEAGFRKQRHNFNREAEPGLIHVVSFPMGPSWTSSYGDFGLSFGVFIQEVHDATTTYDRSGFVTEPDCEIRRQIGAWSLQRGPEALAADVEKPLRDAALPFLDGLASREQVLDAWYREGESLGFPPRGRLSVAVIHWQRGEREPAERLMREFLGSGLAPAQAEFARDVARSLGMRV